MATCEDTLSEIYWTARFCQSGTTNCTTQINLAWDYWMLDDWPNCMLTTIYAVRALRTALLKFGGEGDWETGGPHWYYLDNCVSGGEYELTMDKMINTMLMADPSEVTYFIGLVDAYRQSIWNAPFNKEFYSALARGFMQWP